MADGNIGNLWMTLGLKDEVTKSLKKLQQEFSGTDDKAKKAQNTIKEIESALKKPANTMAIGGAIAQLITLLEKSKDNVRDLALMLKTLDAKDIDRIFNTKATAANATKYREMIDKIKASLNELHRSPGDEALRLQKSLSDASAYLAVIERLGIALKALRTSNLLDAGGAWENMLKMQRGDMASTFNSRFWKKEFEMYSAEAKSSIDALYKEIFEKNKQAEVRDQGIKDSEALIRKAAEANTAALKAEEEQAKKTAAADKELAATREAAAKSAEKQTQQGAGTAGTGAKQGTVRQAAVENKEFEAALVRMTGTGKTAEKIKEGTEEEIKKAEAAVKTAGAKLDGILGRLLGGNAGSMNIGDIAKKAAEGSKAIAELETKLKSDLKGNDAGKKASSGIREAIRNAQTFLDLVQQIDIKMRTIGEKRTAQPNVDTKKLKEANALLEKFWATLRGIMGEGKVEGSLVMGNMPKALTATMREVQWMMRSFDKENPLSVFSGGAAKAEAALSNLTERYKKLLDLQNEGKRNGYDTKGVSESANSLRLLKTELEKLLRPESKGFLTDKAYMTNALSDVAVEMTKAKNAMSEYGREKGKVIAQKKAESDAEKVATAARHESAMEAQRSYTQELAQQRKDSAEFASRLKAQMEARQRAEEEEKRNVARVEELVQQRIQARKREAEAEAEAAAAMAAAQRKREAALQTERSKYAQAAYTQELAQQRKDSAEFAAKLKAQMEARQRAEAESAKDAQAAYTRELAQQRKAAAEFAAQLKAQMEARQRAGEEIRKGPGAASDKGLRNISDEIDTLLGKLAKVREDITFYNHAIGTGVRETVGFGQKGLKDANAEAERLMASIENLQRVRDTLAHSYADSNTLIGNTYGKARRSDELSKMSEYYKTEEERTAKESLRAKRDKEVLERRAQSEAKAAEARYNSLSQMLWKLRAETEKSLSLNVDTSAAEKKIRELEEKLVYVASVMGDLKRGDTSALGKLGGVGTGRDLTLAGRTLSEQKELNAAQEKTNREKEKAIELERKHQAEVARTAARVRNDLAKAFEQAKEKSSGMSQTMQDLKGLLMQGGVVYGAQQFLMSVIQTGGELEKQHIALQSILGDMQNANQMFAQVKELALNSPFTFSELNKDVKQLAAYGVEYDQLYDTTKRLADMSSGLGVSFERIALAFGQVQARGWLDGKELRQISYAGIPLLEKLSEYYSKREGKKVTTSEVKTRISGRGVDFEDVKNVFWEMTDAGGQFYNMQQVLSETLLGRWNKLKDAWEIMLADFASGNSAVGAGLKGIIDLVTTLVQSLHTAAPVVAAAFSGLALRKLQTALGGGVGDALLSGKGSMAADIQRRVLAGEEVSATEMRILQTKKQITTEDLRQLAAVKALQKSDLNRMLITRLITQEQYKQLTAEMGLRKPAWTISGAWSATWGTIKKIPGDIGKGAAATGRWLLNIRTNGAAAWNSFAATGTAALSVIGTGVKTLGATIWTAIGGLPGLLITGASMGIGYLYSKNEELKNAMKQTADEIEDRMQKLRDFIAESKTAEVASSGDAKAIDNLIDEYKEKLKKIAPYNYSNLVMKAVERQSHAERLKYLDAELRKLQEAEKVAKAVMGDKGNYKALKNVVEYASDYYGEVGKRTAKNVKDGMSDDTARGKAVGVDNYAQFHAGQLKKEIEKAFGDIGKDETARMAAMQAMDSIFTNMGLSKDRADVIRASVLQAFGVGDQDAWLQSEVSERMRSAIAKAAPEIGDKIRSGQTLTKAEQDKVKELMADAKRGVTAQYPDFERTLQGMLAASNFEAVIKLVYETSDELNGVQSEMMRRVPQMPGILQGVGAEYRSYAQKWGKEGSWYAARNAAKTDIDAAWNEYKSAKDSGAKEASELFTKWDTMRKASKALLKYDYEGEGKKSNKEKKSGREKDTELEELQRKTSDLKAARQMYEKYKGIGMGKAQARNRVMELFGNLKSDKISLDDYEGSVRRLMAGFDFGKSEERKKAKTSLEREMGEWEFSEKLKPEYDRVAANFKEALEKGVRQVDLEKELLEKTGSKELAAQAWKDGAVWDAHTLRLRDEFKELTGADVDWTMADADAKKLYDGNEKAYTLWQKITQLVTDKYVKSLQQAADIMEKTATTEEKAAAVRAKYAEAIRLAEEGGDVGLAERYRQQRDKEETSVRTEAFKQSPDYLMFYEAIAEMGADKAQEVARQIRENLNAALADGSIDAREYAKQAEQLEGQLEKLASGRKTLWNAGFGGRAERMIESGTAKTNAGLIKIGEGERLIREGKIEGDAQKVLKGEGLVLAGKILKDAGEKLADAGRELKKGWDKAANAVDKIDSVVQGLTSAFGDITETASALGVDTESDGWQNAKAVMGALSGMSSSVSGIVKGVRDGDVGGVIKGAVGVITSPIKAFAAAHDAKRDREIKLAERNITELERIEASVKTLIEKTLGGVYSYTMDKDTKATLQKVTKAYQDGQKGIDGILASAIGAKSRSQYSGATYAASKAAMSDPTNAYKSELALMMAQRDELQRQRNNEADKKKKDKDKLADYDEELKQIGQTIKSLSEDYLKEIYSIDMKSWASQLTDAVVSAWEKGEDAMDAYRKKAKELVKDVTKTVVSQKLMEKALEKPLEYLEGLVEQKGRLDEGDMGRLVDELTKAGDDAVYNITAVMDALKAQGYDFSESGTGSVSSSVKNITEETADVLASYLNAIRLDVSVNRANVKNMAELMKEQLPEMGQIQRAQLTQLTQIVSLAEARNEKLDRMMDWMTAVTTSGRKKVYVG